MEEEIGEAQNLHGNEFFPSVIEAFFAELKLVKIKEKKWLLWSQHNL